MKKKSFQTLEGFTFPNISFEKQSNGKGRHELTEDKKKY